VTTKAGLCWDEGSMGATIEKDEKKELPKPQTGVNGPTRSLHLRDGSRAQGCPWRPAATAVIGRPRQNRPPLGCCVGGIVKGGSTHESISCEKTTGIATTTLFLCCAAVVGM